MTIVCDDCGKVGDDVFEGESADLAIAILEESGWGWYDDSFLCYNCWWD